MIFCRPRFKQKLRVTMLNINIPRETWYYELALIISCLLWCITGPRRIGPRRHNQPDGVSNHRRLDCLLNRLCLSADQRIHQSSASLSFVRGIHRWSVNSPHKGPVNVSIPWRHYGIEALRYAAGQMESLADWWALNEGYEVWNSYNGLSCCQCSVDNSPV